MALTQEAILETLLEGRGKLKNTDLLNKFREPLNCSDPEEKKQNRALFKTFVNNIAVVKEFEGNKYIVLKKLYHHLLDASNDENAPGGDCDEGGSLPEEDTRSRKAEGRKSVSRSSDGPIAASPIETALERSRNVDFKPVKSLHFTVPLKPDPNEAAKKEASTNKRYALPLRMPQENTSPPFQKPPENTDSQKPAGNTDSRKPPENTDSQKPAGNTDSRKPPENTDSRKPPENTYKPAENTYSRKPAENTDSRKPPENTDSRKPQSSPVWKRKTESFSTGSPQLRKHFKSPKPTEEAKVSPHESMEHQLMVKSAAGLWTQVYGILLSDPQLAEKKDFMSGFTVLHWAVKCGNADMVIRIIELSKKNCPGMDINVKSNGGYTPLHIAAIHSQLPLIRLLLLKYGADKNTRDNCGRKAYYYLNKDVQQDIRELMGDPKAARMEIQQGREDDPQKNPKNRLFPQTPVGLKKKSRTRPQFMSLAEESRPEREEPSHKQRLTSDVFP